MKKLLKALLVLVMIPVLWIVVSFVGNQFDEDLNPSLQTLLQETKTIRPTDGGEIRLGILWDIPNWREEARDVLNKKKSLSEIKAPRLKWDTFHFCQETQYYCSKEQLEKHQEKIQSVLLATEEARKRYELLLESQDYEDPYEKTFASIPHMTFAWSVSRAFHLSAQQMPPEKAVSLLIKEGKMLRKFLENRTSLLAKLVDLIDLERNLVILRNILQENPDLRKKQPADYLAAYQNLNIHDLMRLALEGEMAFVADAVDNVETSAMGVNLMNMGEEPGSIQAWWGKFLTGFLQPNVTKNMFYKEYMRVLESKCWKDADQADCERLNQESTKNRYEWLYSLTNQVGQTMKLFLVTRIFYQPSKTKMKIDSINSELAKIQGPGGLI
jgi:hypothetical protein